MAHSIVFTILELVWLSSTIMAHLRFDFDPVMLILGIRMIFFLLSCSYFSLPIYCYLSYYLWAHGDKKSSFGRRAGYDPINPSHTYKINRTADKQACNGKCQCNTSLERKRRSSRGKERAGPGGGFLYGHIQYSRPHTLTLTHTNTHRDSIASVRWRQRCFLAGLISFRAGRF